jgi:hypothetical protein
MTIGASLQVKIGHLFQVRTEYLIHQQRRTLTEGATSITEIQVARRKHEIA